ncbi:MAG: zinc protease [Flavobacteriales bacterium]|jgi:zinc protease
MISFKKTKLSNGLTLIVHQDKSTPIAAFNLLYDVGSKHETEDLTGFAHLFEHLMFEGSENIPSFDKPLQMIGAQNNAFTSTDVTNYYITVPKDNIETAFWLESDRLNNLAFSEKSLALQKNVVIEEFKQRYLNQPYGDIWLKLRPLAYKTHPYRWATIGKNIQQIEDATLDQVKAFFNKHYVPENAILVVAGDIEYDQILSLTEKWFGGITKPDSPRLPIPREAIQQSRREERCSADVPQDAIYMAFQMPSRGEENYVPVDLVSDVLSRGDSSRFYKNLIKGKQLFSELDAFVTGEMEQGLFVVAGKLSDNVTFEEAEKAIWNEINQLKENLVSTEELQKVINKVESTLAFSEMEVLNKAMNLAFAELLGDANLVNEEINNYLAVTPSDIQSVTQQYLGENQVSVLFYEKAQ